MRPDPATHHPTTPRPAALRAADTDRDTTIERLADALADGALDLTEYEHRLDQATTATTVERLERLTADLPVSRAALAEQAAARAEDGRRQWRNEWGYWAGGAGIMTTIWAVGCIRDSDWDFYWPLAPLAIWAAILVSYAIWPERD
ncbi:DUF1707 domain-containing protein [Actinomadura sp. 9N407]|uniref:DUF1707 domain-containing protein n=1 Tax=Actinomadura sp. 9N407 TaxID=3375154 RepID=UPI0037AD1556